MAVTSLDLAAALRDEVVALMRGAEERVRFDLAAGEDVVPGRALLDDAALNLIVNNAIGLDSAGAALGNAVGIRLQNGADHNTIGSDRTKLGNLVAGNIGDGVIITSSKL